MKLSALMKAQLMMYIAGGFMLFFTLSIIVAPLFFPADTVNFGKGSPVGTNDFQSERDKLNMTGYIGFLYWQGDLNCNQIASRSFFLNGNQMPVCSRCLAIYAGMSIGILFSTRRLYPIKGWGLILGILPMIIDGGIQLFGVYESNNLIRVVTGLLAGGTVGIALAVLFLDLTAPEEMNKLVSKTRKPQGVIRKIHRIFERVAGQSSPGDAEFFFLCLISLILVVTNISVSVISSPTP